MLPRRKKKYDGNRNPYKNRQTGKAVEYATVKYCKERGWWAKRNPDRDQNKDIPIDVFVWNPFAKEFWGVQCKRHKKLLFNNSAKAKDEVQRIITFCNKWGMIPYLAWRENGIKLEVIG